MNLMSNARLFQDDVKSKNDLMFDMLPQLKFRMMGEIDQESKKPSSSSSSSVSSSPSPSPNASKFASPPDGEDASSNQPSTDSPLDFSTKKQKFDKVKQNGQESSNSNKLKPNYRPDFHGQDPESPSTRLRNILKMKSPVSPVQPDPGPGTILNLSLGNEWNKMMAGSSSDSSSPTPMDIHSLSPKPTTMAGSGTGGGLHSFSIPQGSSGSLGLPAYAMFSPNLSPVMAQTSSTPPIPFESPSGPRFSQFGVSVSSGNPNLPFGSMSMAPSGVHTGPSPITGKPRVSRPFKAYPKDPMTFPTVGLYGLPTVVPTPGTPDVVIQQQSNHAYSEFRKQMLSQANNSRTRRVGQMKNFQNPAPLSDSTTSSTNPSNFGLGSGLIASETVGSGTEDCLSNSDDGYSHVKNKANKSDEQQKDEAYWERRRKNNEAAKRSRDARRAKEDEIAIRAAFLEQENLKLRFEVCALKNEAAKLRCMLYKAQ